MNYYIYYQDEVHGAYTSEQMEEMKTSGLLTPDLLVFAEGSEDWAYAKDLPGLFDADTPSAEPSTTEQSEPTDGDDSKPANGEEEEKSQAEPDQKKPTQDASGASPKKGITPTKKTGFSLKNTAGQQPQKKGIAAKKTFPSKSPSQSDLPPDQTTGTPVTASGTQMDMTPEQKQAYEKAMANKDSGAK